ncbi:hypothetical protein SAMN04487894_11094 [Niabella drilacis]|uniref:Uncharacterized protein n=1 Tax=Niabella drilacis (strain DSM 25811 / CCM 8410 / CCUG 62505 / LMG 26954 / E90) TaxID=1285928 RepID=A0A1G6VQ21_NIADE|nr:hypothetical protein SAMN04487894_11094 [Niabella drilacis]
MFTFYHFLRPALEVWKRSIKIIIFLSKIYPVMVMTYFPFYASVMNSKPVYATASKIFPAFKILLGSNAFLISRISWIWRSSNTISI